MRFFFVVCLFGIFVASIGCMTRNWSLPLFKPETVQQDGSRQPPEDLDILSNPAMERALFGEQPGPGDR